MKRKKVKIYYGNLFLLIGFVLILVICVIFLFKRLNLNNSDSKKESDTNNYKEVESHLLELGYNEKEAEVIVDNMSESDIMEMDKKYDKLSEYVTKKYFHIENMDRYLSLDKEYDIEEVIMRVNTNIDKPFYTDIKKIEDPSNLLVLVNKYNKLDEDYVPEDLVEVENGKYMRREAAEEMKSMINDLKSTGLYIQAQSGYRSYSYQEELYEGYVEKNGQKAADAESAKAGHSEHQTGLAMDLSIDGTLDESFGDTPQFDWLSDNAYKYGYILRYKKDKVYMTGYAYEPWHYRYVGVEAATIIHNEDITYEEYCVKYLGLY